MRNAPPVRVPVGRFVWGSRIALALAVLSALVCLWAVTGTGDGNGRGALIGTVWCMTAGISWWAARQESLPSGELSWDGSCWCYCVHGGSPQPASLVLHWDAGQALLLGLRVGEPVERMPRYVWLQAGQMPLQWHGLRCAIHSRDTL